MSELSHYISLGIGVVCILIGYALGRNSADKPIVNPYVSASLKKKPSDSGIDPFVEAMQVDEDTAYPTIK